MQIRLSHEALGKQGRQLKAIKFQNFITELLGNWDTRKIPFSYLH